MGVSEWLILDSGEVLYVVKFKGQRILNKLSLHSCMSSAPLVVGQFDGNQIGIVDDALVDKQNQKMRKLACSIPENVLVDVHLAGEAA
jgi:hypothetical protein